MTVQLYEKTPDPCTSLFPLKGAANSMEYELYSVVIHRGAAHGGHYHSYIRDLRGEGVWERPAAEAGDKKKQEEGALVNQGPLELRHSVLLRITSDKNPSTDVTTLCKVCREKEREAGL